jgi:hypothetical protein
MLEKPLKYVLVLIKVLKSTGAGEIKNLENALLRLRQ